MDAAKVRRQHRAAIALALANPVEQRGRRDRDAPVLQAIAELHHDRDARAEPTLDLFDRSAFARRVELVKDVLLNAGRVRAGAIRDAAQQISGRRATTRVRGVEHGHEELEFLGPLHDDIVSTHS